MNDASIDVLALDVSSVKTGWAHLAYRHIKDKNRRVRLINHGVIRPGSSVTTERLIIFEAELKRLVYTVRPTVCVIEELNHTRNMGTVRVLGAFLGAAKKVCYEFCHADPEIVPRTHALKLVAGKGSASKDSAKEVVQELFKIDLSIYGDADEDVADAITAGYAFVLEYAAKQKD